MVIAEERFWAKVNKTDDCWLWTASVKPAGYGQFRHGGKTLYAHRYAYESSVGMIPDRMTLDHLCRVRHCVRPDHLEPVTNAENVRRGVAGLVNGARERAKTHCPQGHPYDEVNTYRFPDGRRGCRQCSIERKRRTRGQRDWWRER